jgi:glycosyltransferase involved in cell wall biosynthesis
MQRKRRVVILAPHHLSSTPRAVRNAAALAEAGLDVTVVYGQVDDKLRAHDRTIEAHAAYRTIGVDLTLTSPRGWLRRRAGRMRQELAQRAHRRAPLSLLAAYGFSPLAPLVATHAPRADVVLAQQQAMLPFGAQIARKTGAKLVVDIEDLLADSPAEPVELIRNIERKYLPKCAAIFTMSGVAARRLADTNALRSEPIAIYNTPSLSERRSLVPPAERAPTGLAPSIYWFGQTIGTQSRADLLLSAASKTHVAITIGLRGTPRADFVEPLVAQARALGLADRLAVLPRALPDRMVELAGEHQLLLGSQPTGTLFNELAIGNKVFTGFIAGLAIILTDTPAHRELQAIVPDAVRMYRDSDPQSLADAIDALTIDAARLRSAQTAAWQVGTTQLSWEVQAQKLVQAIERVL